MLVRHLISVGFVLAVSGCSALAPQARGDATLPATIARASANLTTLYSFQGQPDGATPRGRVSVYHLCTDVCSTMIFGNTSAGGANNAGTIYSLYSANLTGQGGFAEKVRLSYTPSTTGSDPTGSVIAHSYDGPTFGTASKGGADGKGTVVELPGFKGTNAVRSFDGHNGASPTGLASSNGFYPYYAATFAGGHHNLGAIVLIRVAHNKLRRPEALYSFAGTSDGEHPNSQIGGALGSRFYGTTAGSETVPPTVYEFVPGNGLTTLYTFATSEIGVTPTGVIPIGNSSSKKISLIGATLSGGSSGYGTLYELKPQGSAYTMVTLHTFAGGAGDGAHPYGPPVYAGGGSLYIVTANGGSKGCGTIFSFHLTSGAYGLLHSFKCGKDGANPEAPLTPDLTYDNLIYGTTSAGGTANRGVVFSFTP